MSQKCEHCSVVTFDPEHQDYCKKNPRFAQPTEPPASEPPACSYSCVTCGGEIAVREQAVTKLQCKDCAKLRGQAASSHTELRARLEALVQKWAIEGSSSNDVADTYQECATALEAALSGAGREEYEAKRQLRKFMPLYEALING